MICRLFKFKQYLKNCRKLEKLRKKELWWNEYLEATETALLVVSVFKFSKYILNLSSANC